MYDEAARLTDRGYINRWRGLLFIGVALIVISLDNTILNVALPSISRTLGASASDLQWIVDSYVLVFAALLLTLGAAGDRFGRKRALQVGLFLFGVGSLAAAFSTTTTALILARAFSGLGGATIMPATLSLVTATFPREERPRAIATWAAIFGLGVGLGPVIGGFLVEHFPWSSVFFVNIPIIAVAIIGGQLYLGESKDESAPRLDIPGVILSVIGLFALIYAIIEAGSLGWTNQTVLISFGVAAIFLGLFMWWEIRTPYAMLPMSFFRNPSFTGANVALALTTFGLFGVMFFISQYFQTVQNQTPFVAGLRIVPQALALTFAATRSAIVAARIGTKYTVALGIFITACGMFYASQVFHVDTPYWQVLIGQIVILGGIGLAVSPATNSVMGSVPVRKAGVGSAMNDTTRQLGGALGIAILGSIMSSNYLSAIKPLRAILPESLFNLVGSSIQAAHVIAASPLPIADSTRKAIIDVTNQAFVNGMNSAMVIATIFMLVAVGFVLAVLPHTVQRMEERPIGEVTGAVIAAHSRRVS